MNSIRISAILKATTITGAVLIAPIVFWFIPYNAYQFAYTDMPSAKALFWAGIAGVWIITALVYMALFQFWKVCGAIKTGDSFSRRNAGSFKKISLYALISAAVMVIWSVFFIMEKLMSGIWIFILALIIVAAVIAVLTFCLSKLIENAAEIKEENDLTV